ncbi:diguanylate cyclase [Legionella hackeliae]|uniref:diguanylate cyclase n=1 Tax=Legionella hackeliae TaxID=449 RepID=A0A0A8UTI3_LEGHA|nr:diguanylate cyclase [Legionella hackeliae]KTD12720.1 regulatory protein (GGDEF domain) [Legionella hackeliae]CEK12140.1 putative regulatory protein (GGDEF domain) [Legionella hackeliae]STX48925.1 regulatory protein (GGDEF domain) [Legionella hackeliae]
MEKIANKLHELFIGFSKNLPNKIEQIEQAWQEQMDCFDHEKFKVFHRYVHSLCGSAGTYGYTELSKAARELEIYLKNILDNSSLNEEEEQTISHLLIKLKEKLELPPPKMFSSILETKITENKVIYILEQEKSFAEELGGILSQAGYSPELLSDLSELENKIERHQSIALLVDTHYLMSSDKQKLLTNLLKKQNAPLHLFCIVPNSQLAPRLIAVRAGCSAFFQKPVDIFHLMQVINQKCSFETNIPFRILIVDDSESLGEYYSLILKQAGMVAKAINNPMDIFKQLEKFRPDLILMDIYMPECTGLELALVLRKEDKYNRIPIIFLSTEHDKRKQMTALSVGGDDFLTKPITPAHLVSAVRVRSQRAGVLNYYMSTDSLTGLLNHSSFLKRLELELDYSKQNNSILSLVMVDIDNFKKVNDNYGHPFGDTVIKKLATLLTLRLRNQDIIGRYGGEEFAILLPQTTAHQSKKIIEEIRLQFSSYCFPNTNFFTTFSAGIAQVSQANSMNEIVNQADQALYEAKNLGRNQIVIFKEIK